MSMKKQKNFLDPLFSSDEEEEEDIGTTSSSDNKDSTGKDEDRGEDKEDMVTLSQINKRQNKSSPSATNNPNSSSKVALVSTEGSTSKRRQLFDNTSNLHARKRAKELQANLEPRFSSWVKSMSETHVDRRFKLGIPEPICTSYFPKRNIVIDLVDEYQDEYQVQYSVKDMALIRGWKDFALAHELVKGDVLVFQFVKPTEIKVYVIRAYTMAETDGVMTMSINNSDARGEKVRPCELTKTSEKTAFTLFQQEEGNLRSLSEEVDSEVLEGVRLSDNIIEFKEAKNMNNFCVAVNGKIIDNELSEQVRTKYNELCCSQNVLLHEKLFEGINPKLAAGAIAEITRIADCIRSSKLSTTTDEFAAWDKKLKAFEDLGMNVSFLRARIRKLLGIVFEAEEGIDSRSYTEAIAQRDDVKEQIKDMKVKLDKLEEASKRIDNQIKILKAMDGQYELNFKELVDSPW